MVLELAVWKQEKVKGYPSVETQVNSARGHINVTEIFLASSIYNPKIHTSLKLGYEYM